MGGGEDQILSLHLLTFHASYCLSIEVFVLVLYPSLALSLRVLIITISSMILSFKSKYYLNLSQFNTNFIKFLTESYAQSETPYS